MLETLKQVNPDGALLVVEVEPPAAGAAVLAMWETGLIALVVRGRKMRTRDALYDELGAALQFPSYFGENWNAVHECISDLDWWPFGEGRVILVEDADQVLADSDEVDELEVMVRSFRRAHEEFAAPIAQGAWFDRPPIPFHVVLQVEPAVVPATHARWSAAGAKLRVVELAPPE